MKIIRPFQNQPKAKSESYLVFFRRKVIFHISIFSFLMHQSKQRIPAYLFRVYQGIFLIQIFFYLNYTPLTNAPFNKLYRFICSQIYLLNPEKLIFYENDQTIVYFYLIFFGFYIILWILVTFLTIVFSIKKDFSKQILYKNKKTTVFLIFTNFFYFNYYCLGGIAVTGVFSHLKSQNLALQILNQNSPLVFLLFKAAVFSGFFVHLFEFIIDVFGSIIELKEKTVGIRTKHFTHFLTFVSKYLIITSFFFLGNYFNSLYASIIRCCIFLALFIFSLFEIAFQKFSVFTQNLFLNFVLFSTSLCKILQQTAHPNFDAFSHILILLLTSIFAKKAAQIFIIKKAIRQLLKYHKNKMSKIVDLKTDFALFSSLFYLYNNRAEITLGHFFTLMYLQIHKYTCSEITCKCNERELENWDKEFQRVLEIFYLKFTKLFEDQNNSFLNNLQKIEYSVHLQKNNFDSFLFVQCCNQNSIWITNKLSYFNALINIENLSRITDQHQINLTKLGTSSISDVRIHINQVQSQMLDMLNKYKEFLEELLPEIPSPQKLRELLWQTINLLQIVEGNFPKLKSENSSNYKLLYTYFLFFVYILNEDEQSALLIQRLSKLKNSLDTLGVKKNWINHKFGENSTSMVVVATSLDASSLTITHLFDNYKEFIGLEKEDIVGKLVNLLMPNDISAFHNVFIEKFFQSGQGKLINTPNIFPVLHKDKYFIPLEFLIRVIPDLSEGLRFVCIFTDKLSAVKNKDFNLEVFEQEDISFLTFDEEYKILGINHSILKNPLYSPKFLKTVLDQEGFTNFTVYDFFPQLASDQKIMKDFLKGETVVLGLDLKNTSIFENQAHSNLKNTKSGRKNFYFDEAVLKFYVQLITSKEYGSGRFKLGMLCFYNTEEKVSQFTAELGKRCLKDFTTYGYENQRITRPSLIKTQVQTRQETPHLTKIANYDSREMKELKENYMKSLRPKKDKLVLIIVTLILCFKIGMFVCTYALEGTLILDFFKTYPRSSIALSNQLDNFVRLMTNTMDLDLASFGMRDSANTPPVFDVQAALTAQSLFVNFTQGNYTTMLGMINNYALSGFNASSDTGVFGNVNVWTVNPETSDILIYNDNFFSLTSQMTSLNYLRITDLDFGPGKTQTNNSIINKAINFDLAFLWQNTINNYIYNSGNFKAFKKQITSSVFQNYSTFKIIFFTLQFVILLALIILVAVFLVLFKKSTNQLIFLFLKIDTFKIKEFIQKGENFAEILKFMSKSCADKIDFESPISKPKKLEIKNVDLKISELKTSNLEILSQAKKSEFGATESLAFSKERSSLRKIAKLNLSDAIDRKTSMLQGGLVNGNMSCLLLLLCLPVLMLLINFAFYMCYNPSFKYLTSVIDEFIFYKNVRVNFVALSYMKLFTNSSVIDPANYTAFDIFSTINQQTINEIFRDKINSILPTQINANLISLNTDACSFAFISGFLSAAEICDNPQFNSILNNGFETSFTYLRSQFNNLQAQKDSGITFANLWNQTQPLITMNYFLGHLAVLALTQALNDVDSVSAIIYNGFYFLAIFEFLMALFYFSVVLPKFHFYLKKQSNFFRKIFELLSLKTISENKRLLSAFGKEEFKTQKIENL